MRYCKRKVLDAEGGDGGVPLISFYPVSSGMQKMERTGGGQDSAAVPLALE